MESYISTGFFFIIINDLGDINSKLGYFKIKTITKDTMYTLVANTSMFVISNHNTTNINTLYYVSCSADGTVRVTDLIGSGTAITVNKGNYTISFTMSANPNIKCILFSGNIS